MGEIVSFFKDMLNINSTDNDPIGLCGFENSSVKKKTRASKPKRKREMRLSELMGN